MCCVFCHSHLAVLCDSLNHLETPKVLSTGYKKRRLTTVLTPRIVSRNIMIGRIEKKIFTLNNNINWLKWLTRVILSDCNYFSTIKFDMLVIYNHVLSLMPEATVHPLSGTLHSVLSCTFYFRMLTGLVIIH